MRVAIGRDPLAQEALAKLCQIYWHPLYVYVRRQGGCPQDAQDSAEYGNDLD